MTASVPRLSVIPGKPAARGAQKSCSNIFDAPPVGGRGRRGDGRGAWEHPADLRADFPALWARLVRAKFRSRDDCAIWFGVTIQTACNWFDGGICRPAGDKVALAALHWPDDFAAIIRGPR